MPTFSRGQVVRVPFPYTDRNARQHRPALVVSDGPVGEDGAFLWVAMITSAQNRPWPDDHPVEALAQAGLPIASVVRTAKITTVEARDAEPVGRLDNALRGRVMETIGRLLGRRGLGPLAGALLAITILAGSRTEAAEVVGIDANLISNMRLQYNLAIRSRDAASFAKFLSPSFVEMASSGEVISGAKAVAESYAATEFKDPDFIAYDREPDTVEVAHNGHLAVERGHWHARRRDPYGAEVGASGLYQAGWVHTDGGWRIQTEAYVKLTCAREAVC